jgi:hypothetical protein
MSKNGDGGDPDEGTTEEETDPYDPNADKN